MLRRIGTVKAGLRQGLAGLWALGGTMGNWREDIIAYFDHSGTSNGASERVWCSIDETTWIV